MTKVTWESNQQTGKLYFSNLAVGDCFKIDTRASKGAVYRKVLSECDGEEYQEEIATGKLFYPTASPVIKVDVEIVVSAPKPAIY